MRELTSTYVTSSVAVVRPHVAVYLDFSGSAVRLWSGLEAKTLNDNFGSGSYSAVGSLGNISAITETTDVSAKGIELVLSGVPSENIALALNNPCRGRTMAIYLLLFNDTYTAYEQTMIYRGRKIGRAHV